MTDCSSTDNVRILIINVHSCHNAGDAALLQAAIDQLQDSFPGVCLTVAANDLPSVASSELDVDLIRSFMSLFGPTGTELQRWRVGKMMRVIFLSLIAGIWYRLSGRVLPRLPEDVRVLVDAYGRADLVVSCPGNIFFTLGRIGLPFLVSAYTVAYALLLAKPLYVMPAIGRPTPALVGTNHGQGYVLQGSPGLRSRTGFAAPLP